MRLAMAKPSRLPLEQGRKQAAVTAVAVTQPKPVVQGSMTAKYWSIVDHPLTIQPAVTAAVGQLRTAESWLTRAEATAVVSAKMAVGSTWSWLLVRSEEVPSPMRAYSSRY